MNDTDDEEDETFTVTLSTPANATILRPTATGTILDDDGEPPPILPTLSIGDAQVVEDAGSAEFTVTLSAVSASAVTVAYATSDGTATAGNRLHGDERDADDWRGRAYGDDLGAAGERHRRGRGRNVHGDAERTAERDDSAEHGDGHHHGTEDGVGPPSLPTLSIEDAAVSEGAGSAVFTVTLSAEER